MATVAKGTIQTSKGLILDGQKIPSDLSKAELADIKRLGLTREIEDVVVAPVPEDLPQPMPDLKTQ